MSTTLQPLSQAVPPQASSFAAHWDSLYYFLLYASLVSFAVVVGAMLYFAIVYKRRGARDKTPHIAHNVFLEFLWSFVPFCIFLFVFVWGAWLYDHMRRPPAGALEVHAFAQKWNWEFRYKSGRKSLGSLIVPLNTNIKLIMASRDVVHSFFVPAFRVKQDVVPGAYTSVWFKATKKGTFHLYCAEFCGDGHSQMLGKVEVLSQADYDYWLLNDPMKGLSPLEVGQKLFNVACVACHSTGTNKLVGPGLAGLWGKRRNFTDGSSAVADANYIRESLLNPGAKVVQDYPNAMVPQVLDEDEILALTEYIKSLK